MTTAVENRSLSPDEKSEFHLYKLLATGLVPDWLIRTGIRRMLSRKLKDFELPDSALYHRKTVEFARQLETMPIALKTHSANAQHYEVPTEFFKLVLGPHMKYSCACWERATTLAEAEEEMLRLTCERAELQDGQRVLELGCGWGSFSIYAAERYPRSFFTAVSNSRTQKVFIDELCARKGIGNLQVVTCDINRLTMQEQFDRVVSVEMFEHCKNYKDLLANISSWLVDGGKLFVHIFSHRVHQYHYGETKEDWLAEYFFSGGTMPSHELLFCFQDDLKIIRDWRVNGCHYQKTAEAWLLNMSKNKADILPILSATYGAKQTRRWWNYWRLFFLACAELWGFQQGQEWMVSHYLFEKRI